MDYKKLLNKKTIGLAVALASAIAATYGYNVSPEVQAIISNLIAGMAL